MNVFIGWSGETGWKLAEILKRWLGAILPEIRFLKDDGIKMGIDWRSELTKTLQSSDFGLFCLTKESDQSWLGFELGIMSSVTPHSPICILLFDVGQAETGGPLSYYQSVTSDMSAILTLIQKIWETAKEKGTEVPTIDIVRKRTNLMFSSFQSDLDALWTEKRKRNEERSSRQEETMTEINKKLDAILSALPEAARKEADSVSGLSQSA